MKKTLGYTGHVKNFMKHVHTSEVFFYQSGVSHLKSTAIFYLYVIYLH